jgi:hypothetical protein
VPDPAPIKVSSSSPQKFAPGSNVTLRVDEPESGAAYQWQGPEFTGTGPIVEATLPVTSGNYTYNVTAKLDGNPAGAGKLCLSVVDEPEPLQEYDPKFAGSAAAVCFSAGLAMCGILGILLWRFALNTKLESSQLRASIGGMIAIGLLMIGCGISAGGLFAGLIETRGRMRAIRAIESALADSKKPDSSLVTPEHLKEALEGISKLRGAALILVLGCVPLIAAAWIGRAAFSDDDCRSNSNVVACSADSSGAEDTPSTDDSLAAADPSTAESSVVTDEKP